MEAVTRTSAQLGQVLKARRQYLGMTQAALGAKIGLIQAHVSAIETNHIKPSVDTLYKLLSALGSNLFYENKPLARNPSGSGRWHGYLEEGITRLDEWRVCRHMDRHAERASRICLRCGVGKQQRCAANLTVNALGGKQPSLPRRGRRTLLQQSSPDSDAIRRRIAQHVGANSDTAFDLLEQIGRDCNGRPTAHYGYKCPGCPQNKRQRYQ